MAQHAGVLNLKIHLSSSYLFLLPLLRLLFLLLLLLLLLTLILLLRLLLIPLHTAIVSVNIPQNFARGPGFPGIRAQVRAGAPRLRWKQRMRAINKDTPFCVRA